MSKRDQSPIHNQDDALNDFFDSLLNDVDAVMEKDTQAETTKLETKPVLEQPQVIGKVVVEEKTRALFESLPTVVPLNDKIKTEWPTDELIKTVADDVVEEAAPEVELVAETVEPEETILQPKKQTEQFQAMLFKVAGLTLAVPLVELNGIVEWNADKLTKMPGHKEFYLGLLTHLDKTIPVIDTALFVLPAKKHAELLEQEINERVTRIVLIDDGRYGLACDEVNEVITLQPDEVRWRSKQTKRQWLAGTVIEHMCALIDASSLSALLQEQEAIEIEDIG